MMVDNYSFMKILNVNMSLDPVTGGGSTERTLQISRSLAKAGHQITVLSTDMGLSPAYVQHSEKWGLKIIALPSLWGRFYIPRPSQRLVRNLVHDADIVHLMSHWTLINVLVYRAIKGCAKPYVVCPAGALPIYGRSRILKKLYNQLIGREIVCHANACIAISPNEIEQFESYGIQSGKVFEIPNGINPDDFPESDGRGFRVRYGIGDAPMILYMGRLNIIKGPDLLLEAFCRCNQEGRLHDYHLVFAGADEGMQKELKRTVSKYGSGERVHFTGHISGDRKSDAYYAADLLVIPSRQEAMSIVVLEAGVTGTPVLITDRCGFEDVARVGGGLIVSADVDGLRRGLVEMLQDKKSLVTMGAKLKAHVTANFTWDTITERYLALYNEILSLGSTFH
jgi:glycosyltransferase involved in cell wall biosynthesis